MYYGNLIKLKSNPRSSSN